jgi:addiction module HigA family antidote
MAKRLPKYEAFPPGDLIRDEIEYRGWTQSDLAQIMGRPLQAVNELINGRKAITARTARELEAALGPDAQFWLNMETSYRLYKEAQADPEIRVRARERAAPVEKIGGRLMRPVEPGEVRRILLKPREAEPIVRDEIVGHRGAVGKPTRDRVRVKRVKVKKK